MFRTFLAFALVCSAAGNLASKAAEMSRPFVRCERMTNMSAAASSCLLAVDRANGVYIAGHRNRHGAGFCSQLPQTYGSAANACSGSLFDGEAYRELRSGPAGGWLQHMEHGARAWSRLFATMLGKQHSAAYGHNFLNNTALPLRPQLHPAPPFGTAHISKRSEVPLVSYFPEWRGCWGCVHNDTDAHCCSGKGDCRMGLCMCRGGAFGMDCAHTAPTASAPSTDTTSASERQSQHEAEASPTATAESDEPPPGLTPGLRIYVHEMPFETGQTDLALNSYQGILNFPRGNFPTKGDPLYSAEWRFLHSLLRDPTVRTLDPHEADLFFVPLFTYYTPTGNTGSPRADVEVATQHLKVTMPFFWQRHGGADHIFFATGDKGFCGMDSVGPSQSPIYISHFGLMAGFRDGMSAFDKFPNKFGRQRTLEQQLRKNGWCFAPHKDIVVPAYVATGTPRRAPRGCLTLPRPEQMHNCTPVGIDLHRSWSDLLVHAGGIWGWMNNGPRTVSPYSLGMRQRLYQEFGNTSISHEPHIRITSSRIPDSTWARSKYCLAPAGDGWGIRMAKSAALNCVPLIAQPYVMQGFEDLLPYERFSKRLEFKQVPQLPAMLRAEGLPQMVRMRRMLEVVRPAFTWDAGGLAYNYTILSLCHRAIELHGRLRAGPSASCATLAAALPLAEPHRRVPPWYPPAMRQATEALMRERRCASETAEPTVAGGTASKVCAEVAAAAQADEEANRAERAAMAHHSAARTKPHNTRHNNHTNSHTNRRTKRHRS